MSKKSFYHNSFIMSIVILISRLFGFLRDILLAFLFGTTFYGDAFYLAFKIPNTFRGLLGEGAFTSAFIPIYSEYVTGDNKNEGYFLGNLFLRFSFILILISFFGSIFSLPLVKLVAIGAKSNPEFIAVASHALSITFWYLSFVGLAAFFMALQQANNSFGKPAAGQVVYNIIFILILVFLLKVKNVEHRTLFASAGVLLAGGFQLTYQFLQAKKLKRAFVFNLKKEMINIKRLFRLLVPAIFGQAIMEINILFDNFFALFISMGVISAMYYSYRLIQLPLGIFSVSIATVSLTIFSKKVTKKEDITNDFNKSLRTLTYVILPISSYFIGSGLFIIKFLFLRGKFTELSAQITNSLFIFYSIGLIFYSYVKLFSQAFYAHKLIKYPVIFTSVAMILNIEMNAILIPYMGAAGLALASTISASVNFFFLNLYLKRKLHLKLNFSPFFKLLPVTVISALGMFWSQPYIIGFIHIKNEFFSSLLIALFFLMITIMFYLPFLGFKNILKILEFFKKKS
ncbi:murein biosynthesis integral membrane protein MurJ [bacterium]|nr:murein biosynthesis integral membrane protein MurJ [bacterium]